MTLSIIIVSSNCRNDLLNCLASIYQFPPNGDFEIIVVDNASSDGTPEAIRSRFPAVKLIANPKNLGFAGANNIGAKNANGDYLFFLNPDTIINNTNTLTLIHRCIGVRTTGKRGIAIAGPKLLDRNGDFQWSCGPIPSVFNMILDKPLALAYRWFGSYQKGSDPKLGSDPNLALRLLSFLSYRYYQGQEAIEVGFVSGAALMIKREVFDQLNGFDEKFFLYFEDVDLCLRAQEAGYRVFYDPSIAIIHLSGQSHQERLKQKEGWYYESQDYFFGKHKSHWEQEFVKFLRLPYRLSRLRSKINKYY